MGQLIQTTCQKTDSGRGAHLIDLPRIEDTRGNLTFIEEEHHVPFRIKRVYWIYDVPGGQTRGGHAFRMQHEMVCAISGSLDVVVHNGSGETRFHMNRSYYGLYIPAGLWRYMDNFSTNSVAMVISSTGFDDRDYIRDFPEFIRWITYGCCERV